MKAKKLLSLLLLIAMTISMLVPVQAADTSGKIGDNVTWTYDASTKTITLRGSGATYDYTLDKTTYTTGSPLDEYRPMTERIIVEEGVTYLGEYIYWGNEPSEIYIPKSVTKIKGNAFGIIFDFDNTHVYYAGTEAEWNALDRGYDYYFEEAIMHYGTASSNSNISSAPVTSTPQTSTATTTKATQTATSSNTIKVYIDSKIVSFDVQPQLIGGRTMVPLRAIFEGLGATVEWDNNTQTVTAYNEVKIVKATIGSNTMTVNGANKTMDVAPMIVDGRTLVPARFVAEAFDCDVEWDGNTKTVSITTKPIDYSKVEQDISVTTPSTTPSTTTPSVTTTPSQVTVPDKKEEINTTPIVDEKPASNGAYKVETLKKDTCLTYTGSFTNRSGSTKTVKLYVVTQVGDDIYYVNEELQIMKLNIVSGETSVYKNLKGYKDKDGRELTDIDCLYYDNARKSVNACCNWEKFDVLNEKTYEYNDILILSTMKTIDEIWGEGIFNNYVYGTNADGDVYVPVSTYNLSGKIYGNVGVGVLPFPNYDGGWNVDRYNYGLNANVKFDGKFKEAIPLPIEVKEAGGEIWYLTYDSEKITGVDDNYKYVMNKNYLIKTDYEDNVIESCKYTDIDLIDGEELYNIKMPRLFIGSNGEVVFYDLELNAFRRITKN